MPASATPGATPTPTPREPEREQYDWTRHLVSSTVPDEVFQSDTEDGGSATRSVCLCMLPRHSCTQVHHFLVLVVVRRSACGWCRFQWWSKGMVPLTCRWCSVPSLLP